MELYNRLCTITKQENVMKDEPMKKHTTFRIGGPADYFVTPESKEEIQVFSFFNCLSQILVNFLWQTLLHNSIVKYVLSKDVSYIE